MSPSSFVTPVMKLYKMRSVILSTGMTESAKALTGQTVRTVDPKVGFYVHQREFAVTVPADDSVSILGSDDATTCHLAVLRHTGNGVTCVAHFDELNIMMAVSSMVNAVKGFSAGCTDGCLELHLIGGFCDDRRMSKKISLQILEAFGKQQEDVHLKTFCVTELNDVVKNGIHWPIIYGIGVDVKTGEIFNASFPDRGPDEVLRSVRTSEGRLMEKIYDSESRQVQIEPFCWYPYRHVEELLAQSDEVLLQCLSTSPLVEPPHFISHIKKMLMFLRDHPCPSVFFPEGKPRVYKRNSEGLWDRVYS
ncbi:protein N-terminal asparagine amidohydrolase isoform X2 [Protopterus annectens]|uniref:protein N-terminal asparagine amidohydrolase isoform X2 n=1 Tax=Protopterus annectens TaxID=7888 RepID=UPI001CF9B105|nr:protein N-terminal asparagine amidohydrolase isoform X2 [Protopterus annectens]